MKQRIFIGPREIAGYWANLTKGLQALGVDVTFVAFDRHPFKYGGEEENYLVRLLKYSRLKKTETPRKKLFRKIYWIICQGILLYLFFFSALLRYKVFIFGFGLSLLPDNTDLPFLRLLRKRIIFNLAFGSDMRPPYMNGAFQNQNGTMMFTPEELSCLTKKMKRQVKKIEKYSDSIIGAPFSSSQFAEKPFINYFALGFPHCNKFVQEPASRNKDDSVKILHSPSNPAVKGTEIIIRTVENLKRKGYKIDFVQIVNKPNSEVLKEISRCDFVIDQIYSDTPLAGFAKEAAGFGKPAVVGGYSILELKKYIPEGMFPGSLICLPEELEVAVEKMLSDVEFRRRLGTEVKDFVETKWSCEKVAKRYLCIISRKVPDSWWLNPRDIVYLYGGGQRKERTIENIREMVSLQGVKSLQLSHRPDLEREILYFAGLKVK